MRRCPSVCCLGERCQRCLWFPRILLPGSVPSRYAFFPHFCPFDSRLNRGEIFACCCVASLGWLWTSKQYTSLSVGFDGRQFGEIHSGKTCSYEAWRCRDVLSWDGSRFPWSVEQNQVFSIPWNKVGFILRLYFSIASLRPLLVLRAISLKRLPRCWRTGMVPSLFVFIDCDCFSYSITWLGVGNLRFFRKCRVIIRQRSHYLKSSFRKS